MWPLPDFLGQKYYLFIITSLSPQSANLQYIIKKKLNRERNANPSINKHCAVQYASHLLFELDFSDCSKYKGVDICPLYYSTWCPLSWSQLFNTQLFTSKPVKIRSNYMVNVHLPFCIKMDALHSTILS